MSIISATTNISSILKSYSPAERNKAKNAVINKVRFETPQNKGLLAAIDSVRETGQYKTLNEFVDFLTEVDIKDEEFLVILTDARNVVNQLNSEYTSLVEALLNLSWCNRSPEAIKAYLNFFIDILVAYSKYTHFAIPKLIALWIPADSAAAQWRNGTPDVELRKNLETIHNLLDRILTVIPMTSDLLVDTIDSMFPYYKKATHVVSGYLYNMLWLTKYQPIFMEYILQLVIQRMVILDVNAPRHEIEDTEFDEEEDEDIANMDDNEEIFEMDDCKQNDDEADVHMKHPIAQTLDVCMEKLYIFLNTKTSFEENLSKAEIKDKEKDEHQFFKLLLNVYDNVILPSHNTHHVQFLIFYYCSLKPIFAENFLGFLWNKIINPNVSSVIREASVGYMASFLARSKFVSLDIVRYYIKQLCNWALQYIDRSELCRTNCSLKSHIVFYSVCQAIFYVIAFRSRDLTIDNKGLRFLESLQLTALVTCNFNPLRVCLPAVATAFAGVTRNYQLAYCHTILERNARRKLATIYLNDIATPEETLEVFFPFDPYLLKLSGHRINPHYLQYRASEAEEKSSQISVCEKQISSRKRGDSEMVDDIEVDDFLMADKRRKLVDLAKSQEREAQFIYGISPGFHT